VVRVSEHGDAELAQNGTAGATHVRAVERAISLLFRLAEHRRGVSLQQLAREVGCSKSTVHRLLATLEGMDVVERDTPLGHYRLGRRARELAPSGWARTDLRHVALPYMQDLRDESEETVTLHLLDGYDHVVAEECESHQEIRRTLPLGQRAPLLRGATAKALLAFLPEAEAARILAATRTADDDGPRAQELHDIRSLGYAFSISERVPGGSAISVPIRDQSERVCAALSISGPSFRFTPARAIRCAPALMRAADEIATALGYPARPKGDTAHGDDRA
jgi:IclR family transcriptional regulator, KDG regulon repressor